MSAPTTLEIQAIFVDDASAGLGTLAEKLGATQMAATSAAGGFTPLSQSMGAAGQSAMAAEGSLGPLANGLGATGTSAEETVGKLGPLGNAFGATKTGASETVGSLGPLGNAFSQTGTSAEETGGKLGGLPPAFGATNTAARESVGALSPLATAFGATGTSAEETMGKLGPLANAFGATGSAAGGTATSLGPLSGELTQTSTDASATNVAIGDLGTSFAATRGTADNARGGVEQLHPQIALTGSEATAAVGPMGALGNAFGATGKNAGDTVQPLGAMKTAFGSASEGGLTLGNTLVQTSKSNEGLMTSMKSSIFPMSAVASSIVGMVSSFTGLESAHVAVERSDTMLEAAHLRVQKTQEALTKAVTAYGPQSTAAKDASAAHQVALDRLATQANKTAIAHQRFGEAIAEFATNIAPQAILAGGAIVQIMANMGMSFSSITGPIGGAVNAIAQWGGAAEGAGASAKLLGIAMAILPFAVAVAGFIAVYEATKLISDNAPAVLDFFSKVGSAVPPLNSAMLGLGASVVSASGDFQRGLAMITDALGVTKGKTAEMSTVTLALAQQWSNMGQTAFPAIDDQLKAQAMLLVKGGASWETAKLGAVQWAASVEQSTRQTTDSIATTAQAQEESLKQLQSVMGMTATQVTGKLAEILNELNGVAKGFEAFGNQGVLVRTSLMDLTGTLEQMKLGFVTSSAGVTSMLGVLQGLGPAAQKVGGAFKTDLNQAIKDLTDYLAGPTSAGLAKVGADIAKVNDDVTKQGGVVSATKQTWNQLNDGLIKSGQEMGILSQATGGQAVVFHTMNEAIANGIVQLNTLGATQGKVSQEASNLAGAIERQYGAQNLSTMAVNGTLDAYAREGPVQAAAVALIKQHLAALDLNTGATKKATVAVDDYTSAMNKELVSLSDSITKEELTTAATMKFAAAQGFAAKGLADAAKAYADAYAKNEALTAQLTNAVAVQNNYDAAVAEGKNKFLEMILTTEKGATSQKEYDALLTKSKASVVALGLGLQGTSKDMDLIVKAALGDQTALETLRGTIVKLYSDFNKLGDDISKKLAEAMAKGGKDFSKAVADLSKTTGVQFDQLGQTMYLKIDAAMSKAKQDLGTDLGVMAILIRQNAPNIGAATEQMIAGLTNTITQAGGKITPVWQKIFTDMRNIAASANVGGPTAAQLGILATHISALDLPIQQVNSIAEQMASKLKGVDTASAIAAASMLKMSAAALNSASNLDQMGLKVDNVTGKVTNSAGQMVGFVNKVTGAFQPLPGAIDATSSATTQLSNAAGAAGGVFNIWQSALAGITQVFNSSFRTGVSDAIGYINMLDAAVKTVTTTMTAEIQKFVTNGLVNSLQKGIQNAQTTFLAGWKAIGAGLVTVLTLMVAAVQTFVTTGLVNSLQKGATNARTVVLAEFNTLKAAITTTLAGLTTAIQGFVTTGFINSLQKGATNARTTVLAEFNTMKTTVTTTLAALTTAIQGFVTGAFVNSLQKGATNARTIVLAEFNTMKTTITTTLASLTTAIQSFVTNAFVNSLQKGATNARTLVLAEFNTIKVTVTSTLATLTANIQQFVRTAFVDSLQKGATNTKNIVVADFRTMAQDVAGILNQMTSSIQNAVRTAFVNSLQKGAQQTEQIVVAAFRAMTTQVISVMSQMASAVASFVSSMISNFQRLGSAAVSAAGQVRQLQSSIDALHDKTITVTTNFVTNGAPGGLSAPFIGSTTAANKPNLEPLTVMAESPSTGNIVQNMSVGPNGNSQNVGVNGNEQINIYLDGKVMARIIKKNMFGVSTGAFT